MIHSVSVYMMLIGHLRNSAPLLMMLVRDTCLFLYFADTKTKERRQFVERREELKTLLFGEIKKKKSLASTRKKNNQVASACQVFPPAEPKGDSDRR